ncbi:hypothetical protein CLOP_g19375 [Closterium sp. NIES-67]|nr:hypothetical protein CLOP_g19375 [Closterium sp. NIES-67]
MEPTNINSLPDDVLLKIIRQSIQPVCTESNGDTPWDSIQPKASYILEHRQAEITLHPESKADAAFALLVVSVCRRWRSLAQRYFTSLLVRENLAVSIETLTHAVTCFPNLTDLHLSDGSVKSLDDAFLAHLASSCPKLTALYMGRRIARVEEDEHLITEAGLDRFFQQCSHLDQFAFRCLHRDIKLPPSFFQLSLMNTLALADTAALEAPGISVLSSLSTLYIASPNLDYQQLTSLGHLSSLTKLSILDKRSRPYSWDHSAAPSGVQLLPCLKTLEIATPNHPFLMFPLRSPCASLEQLLISRSHELREFPGSIENLLPCLCELTIRSCKSFGHLPGSFTSLSRLKSLTMSDCDLHDLPTNFGDLSALQTLVLEALPLFDLPDSISQLTSLEALFLRNCQAIRQVPEGFCRLTSLKTLSLVNLPRLILPNDIGELSDLLTFRLVHDRRLRHLPSSFTQLMSLTRLEIAHCILGELPKAIGELSNLQKLQIHGCPIRTFPESITCLNRLEEILLSPGNTSTARGFPTVPKRLDGLVRLRCLDLAGCEPPESLTTSLESLSLGKQRQVKPLPDLSMLRKLKNLSLVLVGTEYAPAVTRSMPQLTRLELVLGRSVRELLFPLAFFPELRVLTIQNAELLDSLPESLGSDLQQLQQLDIHQAEALRRLPDSIAHLQHLTSLEIHSANSLYYLSDIGSVSGLRQLNLSGCSNLRDFPTSVTQLTCLTRLETCGAPIWYLPSGLTNLSRLRRLDLRWCESLELAPEDLTELKSLQYMGTAGCSPLFRNSIRCLGW